ncbi:MAG: amidohydrolase family protein [Pyrinomonadaceae bacterium]|nr:amidohydrolase family protein [Pyrinomonadaceae bacterium]MCX7639706.1 amidohydrolase family protein [Pyrinomonadaceae bacterium]MDW8304608.1 amidohydrolase family protein [Acidobacteriota bacterium]
MKLLIADYVLPICSQPIEKGAVCVENGKIIAIGKDLDLKRKFLQAERQVFKNSALMPGFVNTHSHLELTVLRSFLDSTENNFKSWLLKLAKARNTLSQEEIEISALAGAIEGIKSGVTFFADVGRCAEASLKALKRLGLRGIVFQETRFSPDTTKSEEDFQYLKEKFSSIKQLETTLVKAGISPHSPYTVNGRLLEKIADYAAQEGIKLAIHAAESKQENVFLKKGKGFFKSIYEKAGYKWIPPGETTIRYLQQTGLLSISPLLIHCIHVSDEEIEIIKQNKCSIAHCPKSNAKFGHGRAPLEKFIANEIPVGLGTDSVASNNICDMLEETRFACFLARLKKFITAEKMLELLTKSTLAQLGFPKLGSIEEGNSADLIAIKLNRTAQLPIFDVQAAILFSSHASDVEFVMIAGKEIYRDGKLKNIDENLLKKELIKIADKIRRNIL